MYEIKGFMNGLNELVSYFNRFNTTRFQISLDIKVAAIADKPASPIWNN